MPLYYFNIHRDKVQIDPDGEDLPDQHAAWREATITAGRILQDLDGSLKPGHVWRLEVTDEFRNQHFILRISARKPARNESV
jgi:hypothetical protein